MIRRDMKTISREYRIASGRFPISRKFNESRNQTKCWRPNQAKGNEFAKTKILLSFLFKILSLGILITCLVACKVKVSVLIDGDIEPNPGLA